MAFPTTPYQTTLAAALDASAVTIYTAASTGFAAGKFIVIGKEVLELTAVDTTAHVHSVKRGMKGTAAVKHANTAIVSMGAASAFGPNTKDGVEVAGYDGAYGTPKLPIGSEWTDPDTGYVYCLVDSGQAYVAGTWVSISPAGAATILDSTSKGRVGVIVEAPGSSDRLCWAIVKGSYNAALFAHTAAPVTTGTFLMSASGTIPGALGSITTCNLQQTPVFNVACTVALTTGSCPITGANPGTAYLNFPWTPGGTLKGQFTSS